MVCTRPQCLASLWESLHVHVHVHVYMWSYSRPQHGNLRHSDACFRIASSVNMGYMYTLTCNMKGRRITDCCINPLPCKISWSAYHLYVLYPMLASLVLFLCTCTCTCAFELHRCTHVYILLADIMHLHCMAYSKHEYDFTFIACGC